MSIIPEIKIGDVLTVMKEMPEKSVDCIITSPPYWGLRDYENDQQWGSEKTMTEFIERIVLWANECRRVLKDEGTFFLNIGDKYSKKGLSLIPERIAIAITDSGWCLRNTIMWYKPNHMPTGVKDRFCNTYEPVYFFVKDSGKYFNFPYYSNIDSLRIKPVETTHATESEWPVTISVGDFNTNKWQEKIDKHNEEKIAKYKGKFKNQTKNMGKSPGARASKGIIYSLQRVHKMDKRNTVKINKYISEWCKKSNVSAKDIDKHFGYSDTASHWLRTDPGRSIPKPSDWNKLKEIIKCDDIYDKDMTEVHYVLQNVKNNPKGKNPGDLWTIPTEKCRESHFAVFPSELPRRIIKAFCPSDGVVLDPFAGSGTTGMVAKELEKKSILIDCNPEFKEIIEKRCGITP